ncbi:hypothetical protein [Flavobacterium suzhouense]|uniref:Apea-like HEPN domain-containing protein n=1 Tax=Flavobacterium suzhouense TaxID=1529638 RepID=A0ABW5P016_9FLAO
MTVSEAIIKFIDLIFEVFNLEKDENYEDLSKISDFSEYVISKLGDDKIFLKPLLECFKNLQIDDETLERDTQSFTNIITAEIIDYNQNSNFKMRYRKFGFANSYGSHLPIEFLHNEKYYQSPSSPFKLINGEYNPTNSFNALIDFIIKDNEGVSLIELIKSIRDKKNNLSLLINKKANISSINLYSYLYYDFLSTQGHTELDENHKHEKNSPLFLNIDPDLNNDNDFTQFFELADVINEANFCPDLLTRYLKFYHQLEYIAYRIEIKKIAKNADLERSFITDIHKIAGSSHKDSEETIFKNKISELFTGRNSIFKTQYQTISEANRNVLDELTMSKFGIKLSVADNDTEFLTKLLKLIYKLRNCVVHNKESEFHLTITKLDSYPVLKIFLPWVINIFESKVDSLLRNFDNKLKYENNSIKLY